MPLFNIGGEDPKYPGASIDVFADMYEGLDDKEKKKWMEYNANTARLYNYVYSPKRKQFFDTRKFKGMDPGITTYEGGLQMFNPFMKPPKYAAEDDSRLAAIDAMGLYVDPQSGDLKKKK